MNERLPATFDAREERKVPQCSSGKVSDQSDIFHSDECDEKRSYTPQPRQITMLGGPKQGNKNNRAGIGHGLQMPTGVIAGSGAS